MPQSGPGSMEGSTEGCLPGKVVFHGRSSSTEGCLPTKVVFHQRSSSTKGCLPSKIVFHLRFSSTEGCLPPKVVFQQRSSSQYWVSLAARNYLKKITRFCQELNNLTKFMQFCQELKSFCKIPALPRVFQEGFRRGLRGFEPHFLMKIL